MAPADPVQGIALPAFDDTPAIPDDLAAAFYALMSRAVPRFASVAQRDVGIPGPVDGQLAWVADGGAGVLQIRSAGQWRQIWPLDGAYGAAWRPYTPVLGTGWSVGNGALSGAFQQVGKTVDFRIELTLGSSTVVGTGAWTLPVARRGGAAAPAIALGQWAAYDASASGAATRKAGFVHIAAGTSASFLMINADGSTVSATSPFTWAAGDTLTVTGSYEAA